MRQLSYLWAALLLLGEAGASLLSRGVASSAGAHSRGFFEVLYEDFLHRCAKSPCSQADLAESTPEDKAGFVGKCAEVVTDLLPRLREEYTEKQVGAALFGSCEEFNTKIDFRHSEHGNSLSETVLTRARVQCRYFAKTLDRQFQKDKDYETWCGTVYSYMEELTIDPKEIARRFNERDMVRAELQKVQAQWQAYRKEKSAGWAKRRKFKRDLAPWAEGFNSSGCDGEGCEVSTSASEEENKGWTVEAAGGDGEELDVDNKDWLQCCPKDCKVCCGYKLIKGVVRSSSLMAISSTASSSNTKFLTHTVSQVEEDKDCEEDAAADDEQDEEDDADDEEDTDDDKDDESEDSEVDEHTSLIATSSHAGQEPVSVPGGFYYILLKEFNQLPKTKEFLDRCVKVIDNLMPVLEEEYTWKQVPFNLMHNCDVYSTTTDFKVPRMELKHANTNCKYFAKRLGEEFQGKKDYKGWCADVYAQLLRESKSDKLTDKQKEVLKNRKDVNSKVYGVSGQCCPPNCRMCKK